MITDIQRTVRIVSESCCSCGCLFGLSEDHQKSLRKTKQYFYCPNGHAQCYCENEADRLRKQLAALQAAKDQSDAEARRQREQKEATERRLSAQFGENTKLRNRIAAGMCPCCRRPVANLMRHMKHKHPEFKNPAKA